MAKARKRIKQSGLYAAGSKSLERHTATWGRKFGIGLNALALLQVGYSYKAVIFGIAHQYSCSPGYVKGALALVKEGQKWPRLETNIFKMSPFSKACNFLVKNLKSGPRNRGEIVKLARRAGIATRTLERAYARVGVTAPGKRLHVWRLAEE
jgi:hypothetical protein